MHYYIARATRVSMILYAARFSVNILARFSALSLSLPPPSAAPHRIASRPMRRRYRVLYAAQLFSRSTVALDLVVVNSGNCMRDNTVEKIVTGALTFFFATSFAKIIRRDRDFPEYTLSLANEYLASTLAYLADLLRNY